MCGRVWHMPYDIQREGLQHLQAHGAVVVEVLPRDEFDREHIAGAISLPMDELSADVARRLLGSDTQQPIAVYCEGPD